MTVRRATPHEAALLAALHQACFAGSGEPPWAENSFAILLSSPTVQAWIAATAGDVPAGFAALRIAGDEAEILSIGVRPERRRQGHGADLLSAVIDAAARAGVGALFLEVAEDNPAAMALYAAGDFATVGRRHRYYRRPAGAVDAIVMRRAVAEAGRESRGSR